MRKIRDEQNCALLLRGWSSGGAVAGHVCRPSSVVCRPSSDVCRPSSDVTRLLPCPSCSYEERLIGLKASLTQCGLILTQSHLQRPHLQTRSHL